MCKCLTAEYYLFFPRRNNLSSVNRQISSFGKLENSLFLNACFVAIKLLCRDIYEVQSKIGPAFQGEAIVLVLPELLQVCYSLFLNALLADKHKGIDAAHVLGSGFERCHSVLGELQIGGSHVRSQLFVEVRSIKIFVVLHTVGL